MAGKIIEASFSRHKQDEAKRLYDNSMKAMARIRMRLDQKRALATLGFAPVREGEADRGGGGDAA